jgi:hypothetical protein
MSPFLLRSSQYLRSVGSFSSHICLTAGKPEEARKKEALVWATCHQQVKVKVGEMTRVTSLELTIDPNTPLTGFLGMERSREVRKGSGIKT